MQESDPGLVLDTVWVLVPRQWNGVHAGVSGRGFLGPASPRVLFRASRLAWFPDLWEVSSAPAIFSELLWPVWCSDAIQAGCLGLIPHQTAVSEGSDAVDRRCFCGCLMWALAPHSSAPPLPVLLGAPLAGFLVLLDPSRVT